MGVPLFEKQGPKTSPALYDNPFFVEYRHVIYGLKGLEFIRKVLKRGDAPLLEGRPYWRIYSSYMNKHLLILVFLKIVC